MLRGLSESLVSRLLQAFPPDRDYERVEFSRNPMPSPIAHFLAQTLQSRLDIELDRHRSIRSDWFDYDHPDVQHAQLTLGAMLGQHARIPQDEWARLLGEAVHTTLAFLVRPVPTLVEFLFDDEEAVPVRDVYRGLAFFGPYPYLREVATSYLRQRSVQEVERSRFQAVLRHSDREITRDYDATAWVRLLAPLYGVVNAVSDDAERSVPAELLDAFFEDKGAGHILLRLHDASEDPGHRITERELREMLDEPALPLTPPPSLKPAPVAMPEPTPTPPPARPPVAPVRPEIRRILSPLQEERTEPSFERPLPEPSPAAMRPLPLEERHVEEPPARAPVSPAQVEVSLVPVEEPESVEEPGLIGEPDLVEEPELFEEPEPVEEQEFIDEVDLAEEPGAEAEQPAAPSEEQEPDEAPVFVPSMEARIKAAQAPSLAAAREPLLTPLRPPDPEQILSPKLRPVPAQAPTPAPAPLPKQTPAAPTRPAPVVRQEPSPAPGKSIPPAGPSAPPAGPSVPPARPSVPIWQQFQKGPRPPGAHSEPRPNVPRAPEPARGVQQPIYPPSPEPKPGSKDVPIWQQFRKPLSPHQPRPSAPPPPAPKHLGPLEETVLGEAHPPDRNLYIRELFSGSASEYERVLRRLQTAVSWSHASQIIAEEVFRKHRVNIYSEAAITFTNAVEEQYRR